MPRLGGIDALKRIHAFDPSIGVVVLSAYIDDVVRQQAEALGAKAILDKPLDLARLLAALGGEAPPVPAPSRPPAAEAAIDTRPAQPRTMLVAGGDPAIPEMFEEFFVAKGYQVRTAVDGPAAVRELTGRAAGGGPADIDMPGPRGGGGLPPRNALAPGTPGVQGSGT